MYTYSVKTRHNEDPTAPGAFQALLVADETAEFDLQWSDDEHEQYYVRSESDPFRFLQDSPLVVTFSDDTEYE